MRRSGNPSLYWRLLASYLLVILVACMTLYWVGEALAGYFLERHVSGMIRQLRHTGPLMEALAVDIDAAYRRVTQSTMLWGLVASAVAAGSVGFWVSRRIVRPVRKMQRASRRIAAGQYRERLDLRAPGEIAELAQSFNEMAESLEHTEARRVELLANVAHELKTPLSGLKGYVTGMRDRVFEADDETLRACTSQIARLERLVADLSLLSRVETGQEALHSRPLPIPEVLDQAAAACRPAFAAKGVRLHVGGAPRLRVRADAERTAQVLANLLDNAVKHTPTGGDVCISAALENQHEVRFDVQDTGEGVPEQDLPRLFTRFYRVDRARSHGSGQGSGIGLTIAKHYIERQGGRIGVTSEPGAGSAFWFTLPLAATGGDD